MKLTRNFVATLPHKQNMLHCKIDEIMQILKMLDRRFQGQ